MTWGSWGQLGCQLSTGLCLAAQLGTTVTKEMLTAPQTLSLPLGFTEPRGSGSKGLVKSEPSLCKLAFLPLAKLQ